MKVVLHDNKQSLPKLPGDHIYIYAGRAHPSGGQPAATVTEIHCNYTVGGQAVYFKKNTEPETLRFEDAVIWAVRYARTVGITTVHAVFAISRPVDPKLLKRVGGVQIVDKRKVAQFGSPLTTGISVQYGEPPPALRAFMPKTPLQRRSIGGARRCSQEDLRQMRRVRSKL